MYYYWLNFLSFVLKFSKILKYGISLANSWLVLIFYGTSRDYTNINSIYIRNEITYDKSTLYATNSYIAIFTGTYTNNSSVED